MEFYNRLPALLIPLSRFLTNFRLFLELHTHCYILAPFVTHPVPPFTMTAKPKVSGTLPSEKLLFGKNVKQDKIGSKQQPVILDWRNSEQIKQT